MQKISFRQATEGDEAKILEFIKDLAEYEKLLDDVIATEALLKELARIAVERGCGRLEWSCLDWNQPSIDFYLSMGAVSMDEWTMYRATGEALRKLAE